MANIERLPTEPPARQVPGGSTRPSVLVDLGAYPAIARRRDLNERLLDNLCAFDDGGLRVDEDDLELLLLAAGHRFGGESALLRRQAVIALGGIDRDEAREHLIGLALRVVEHDSVRIAALGSLPEGLQAELAERLTEDPSARVADAARRIFGGELEVRSPGPAIVPMDHEDDDGECCCPCCR